MPVLWGGKLAGQGPAVSADFAHALTREILSTELLRVKVILVTLTLLLAALMVAYAISPDVIERIWHGHLPILPLAAAFVPFVLFEVSVLRLLKARLKQGRDVPYARRYLGALIETSLPTVALYLQMRAMGPAQALAFVVPLVYFIFIILSTLRLDFWLSTFTGFVAAAELFTMAMFYRPAQFTGEAGARSRLSHCPLHYHPGLWHAGGGGGHATAPPVRGQHRGRYRARPHHQPVRPARVAASSRTADR